MSRTSKDLKSHKAGFGYRRHKPQKRLTPFIHDANKITGENEVLPCPPNNDIKQEDFEKHYHDLSAKSVRARRKQIRFERDYTTSRARTKIKLHDKKNIDNLE